MKSLSAMQPQEYDVVRLIKTLPGLDLPIGSEGTILIDHTKNVVDHPPAYEVEFTDEA